MAVVKRLSELQEGDKVINHCGCNHVRVVTVEEVRGDGFVAGGKLYRRDGYLAHREITSPCYHDNYIIPASEEVIKRLESEEQK